MRGISTILRCDYTKFAYLLNDKNIAGYEKKTILCGIFTFFITLPLLLYFMGISFIFLSLIIGLLAMRIPYILLKGQHHQRCNDVISTIPLWVNQIYALIDENTIHNALLLTLDKDTSIYLKDDLTIFVQCIKRNHDDKETYLTFLDRYEIDGMRDVMLKLYEFRNISKDKLKYEISSLNKALGKIEDQKRKIRYARELSVIDMMMSGALAIPLLYFLMTSMLLSDLIMW